MTFQLLRVYQNENYKSQVVGPEKLEFGGKDMKKIFAYCGLICSECPVYIATQTGNEELKEQLARDYSTDTCKFEKLPLMRKGDLLCWI